MKAQNREKSEYTFINNIVRRSDDWVITDYERANHKNSPFVRLISNVRRLTSASAAFARDSALSRGYRSAFTRRGARGEGAMAQKIRDMRSASNIDERTCILDVQKSSQTSTNQ